MSGRRRRVLHRRSPEAHAGRGFGHGDLKPDNILVTTRTPRLVLGDFGASYDSPRNYRGTPLYGAPEALRNCETPRSDLWSLGIIFHEMIDGTVPFSARSYEELSSLLNSETYAPPPLARAATAPCSFVRLVGQLLSQDPVRRPSLSTVIEQSRDCMHKCVATDLRIDVRGALRVRFAVRPIRDKPSSPTSVLTDHALSPNIGARPHADGWMSRLTGSEPVAHPRVPDSVRRRKKNVL